MRVTLTSPPFQNVSCYSVSEPWKATSQWPAFWVLPPEDWPMPWVAAFRCVFTVEKRVRDRLHVTADERYELYLDGEWIGRGAERGDRSQWYYESYSVDLKPGTHTLVACVWAMGSLGAWAQVSIAPGFFCSPEKGELVSKLATGMGSWEIMPLRDRTFHDRSPAAGTAVGAGPGETLDAHQTSWGWERGQGEGWMPVKTGGGGYHGFQAHSTRPEHWLKPAPLPQLLNKPWKRFRILRAESASVSDEAWLKFLKKGTTLTIPPEQKLRIIIDLEDYLCAYPELKWSGGAGSRISLGWAEALRDPATNLKRHGAVAADSCFVGPSDEVIADGGADRWWRPLWWRCGCYLQLEIETGAEPLILDELTLLETRYPLHVESGWQTPDAELDRVLAISRRTLEVCLQETYLDCYYEQLMYVGDTRLECLITYALTTDERPLRKAIEVYDSSRSNASGLVAAAHPSNGGQLIPPFALWWVAMVYDFARWRGQPGFVSERLPGVRAVLDIFRRHIDATGVLRGLDGWNFFDWVYHPGGIAPGGTPGGRNAGLQAQWTLILGYVAELEAYAGEPELAVRYRRWQREAKQALVRVFWNEKRGLLADDAAQKCYSEQAQCLALLAGVFNAKQQARVWKGLAAGTDLVKASTYFDHYYFEACLAARRIDLFSARLEVWRQGVRDGFRTTPETFGQTRSDCHGWTAHPLYHYLTGVLGIQPGGLGFETVVITPQLGELTEASGELAHPLGLIRVKVSQRNGKLTSEIELPKGLRGVFRAGGKEKPLRAGRVTLQTKV